MVRYEGGYAVETVFDGSKLGIEPYAVEVTPAGELLVLDSMNSNVYRVQLPLSRCEHTNTASSYLDRHVSWQYVGTTWSSWDSAKYGFFICAKYGC
jgi:hypothetical protein